MLDKINKKSFIHILKSKGTVDGHIKRINYQEFMIADFSKILVTPP